MGVVGGVLVRATVGEGMRRVEGMAVQWCEGVVGVAGVAGGVGGAVGANGVGVDVVRRVRFLRVLGCALWTLELGHRINDVMLDVRTW